LQEGDQLLPPGDNKLYLVNLNFSLPYFGHTYNSSYISVNGYMSFDSNNSYLYHIPPNFTNAITPFCYDLYTINGGNIYYKQITNDSILRLIGDEIDNLLLLNKEYLPNNAFMITYDSVRAFPGNINKNVSFQIIISTNSTQSFATLNYGNLDFQPKGSILQFTQSGYFNKYIFTNPDQSSNVNLTGKWIYNLQVNGILILF